MALVGLPFSGGQQSGRVWVSAADVNTMVMVASAQPLLGNVKRYHRILIPAVAPATFAKDAVAGDPVEGLGVGFLCVGLEDQPFARAPAAGVHQRVEALEELVL